MTDAATPLRMADWCVLGLYGLGLVVGAVLTRRRATDARDYFVGHGQMPAWAVALSVLASALSVATYLGAPESAFTHDLTYLVSSLGAVLAVVLVAVFFIPVFYRQRVITVYDLVGNTFGMTAKRATSATFLLGRVLASGLRLYMAAIPASMLLSGTGLGQTPCLVIAVLGLSLLGTLYTLSGGIASIIWTDVTQLAVTLGAAICAAVILDARIPLDHQAMIHLLSHADGGSKLRVLNWSLDPHVSNTVWTALTGFMLLNLAAYGTDQDLAQRMLTCRNALAGSRAALLSIAISLPVTALFMIIGLLLYIFYRMPQVMGVHGPVQMPEPGGQAFLTFILHEMPPGLGGLMIAGMFAIAFTSLLSAINAMAGAAINDGYRPLRPGRDESHYLRASRIAVVLCGAALALVALICISWHRASALGLLDFAFAVVAIPYTGLLGVFLTALATRRGNGTSVILALVTGIAVGILFQGSVWSVAFPGLGQPPAWPWQMVIGTVVATGVCCLGRRTPQAAGTQP